MSGWETDEDARESHERQVHLDLLEDELRQVREERDRLRDALRVAARLGVDVILGDAWLVWIKGEPAAIERALTAPGIESFAILPNGDHRP